ncbi:glycosyl transferase family protein [Parasphingopyxis sp.]|uniref:glycosyl transferase family protein n=1 Tax=Parasphingopyxis sp. TaxID=1920299 RepID=UPI00262BF082|nr:glycosyl transferase family protein [Parasphingopyxis sp.]
MPGTETILEFIALAFRELALFAACGFLIGALDTLAIDMLWLRRAIRRMVGTSDAAEPVLQDMPPSSAPGAHAVFVPAWDEANVIGAMLETTIRRFAGQDYRLFIGCYPNDRKTMDAIDAVAAVTETILRVICPDPGPTTKADCLNRLWLALEDEERRTGRRFKSVILHDAEDVVHPAEIMLFDRLIDDHDLVQIPVVPLPHPKSPWVAGHYCDEFAEAHGKDLVIRDSIGAGVPSAGVGCAIARDALGILAEARNGLPFDADSLTEDYELGLSLAENGKRGTFARCRDGETGELIAVHAHFPATLGAAVRQKTRWITGIALYGWDRLGWHGGLADFWMRLRDRSAILTALILLSAYFAAILWCSLLIVHLATGRPLPALSPLLSTMLSVNAGLLLWRLAMRAYFTGRTYGLREGVIAIPRAIVSNIIAMISARRAMTRYILARRGHRPVWDKTRHIFPDTSGSP